MHTVLETQVFARHAEAAGMTEDERHALHILLAGNPELGRLIPGTGGARKLRFAKPGSGKSSGYRVITYYAADDIPVFLLDVYIKGEKINLSQVEKNDLSKLLSRIAEEYRDATKRKIDTLGRSAT